MRNLIIRKLSSRAGESIAESLISILIVAVAAIMFAGMVTASRNIIDTSSKWMQDYYKAVSSINEQKTGNGVTGDTADIKVGGTTREETVTTYTYEVGGVKIVSYVPGTNPAPGSTP